MCHGLVTLSQAGFAVSIHLANGTSFVRRGAGPNCARSPFVGDILMIQKSWYAGHGLLRYVASAGIMVVIAACGTDSGPGQLSEEANAPDQPTSKSSTSMPKDLRAAYITSVQREASESYAAIAMDGLVQFENAAQRFVATVDRNGLSVVPNEETWHLGMRTLALGCEGAMVPVTDAVPEAAGNRSDVHREGLEEWYLNGPLGVEQGFVMREAPACAGPKTITMAMDGDVVATLDDADGDGRGNAIRFVDDEGRAVALYTDLFVTDATGKSIPAWLSVDAGEIAIHFDDAGATYPVEVDPLVVTQQAKLLPNELGGGGEEFGNRVGISSDGTLAIVGAKDEFAGFAAVYERVGGIWTFRQKLRSSDGALDDRFGTSVAIDGNTAIVGASADDDKGSDSGSAYVFVRANGVWPTTQTAKLNASDGVATAGFGCSVAISGDTTIIGAYGDDDRGVQSGSAYVFVKPAAGWVTTETFNAKLTASDGAPSDSFGIAVAISGDTAIVGASGDSDNGLFSGSAYVFVRAGSVWPTTQTAKLVPSDGAGDDRFGHSVAISADTVLVGAYNDDDMGSQSGSAYIFVKPEAGWVTTQTFAAKLTASDGTNADFFGISVAISNDTAIVGAHFKDAAYVFVKPVGGWATTSAFTKKLVDVTALNYAETGRSVAIAGTNVLVGSPYNGIGGVVLPFTGSGATWTPEPKFTTSKDTAHGDRAGQSVAISEDGLTAIVGAPNDDDKGNASGSAYVFVRPTATSPWPMIHTAKLTASDGAGSAIFGGSVAISGDTAIIGAYNANATTLNSGSVYVFVKPAGGWVTTQNFTAKLTASDGQQGDNFGQSVALSGDTAIIGARRDDDKGTDSGSAYVFVKPAGGWVTTATFNAKFTASDGAANDFFGSSVALSGDTSIVGAYGSNSLQGSAYVFVKPAGGWVTTQNFTAKLTASDGAQGDNFGYSVALAGNTALVGARLDDDGGTDSGSAYAFVKPAGGWVTTQTFSAKLRASDGAANDYFGSSVGISADIAVIGAYLDDDKGTDSGSVYMFVKPAGGWVTTQTFTTKLTASDGEADDNFGFPVALTGGTAVIGARNDDDKGYNAGAAYVLAIEGVSGTACTGNAACISGFCVDGVCCQVAACTALDSCHDVGTCQAGTGTCSNPAKMNGASCADSNACNGAETCQAGMCTAGTALDCNDNNACTNDSCNAANGCVNSAVTNGASCADSDTCNGVETCQAGVCTAGTPVTCTALDECHNIGTCDSATGLCDNPVKANGSSCNDNNACTETDTCQSGTCIGQAVTCTALDECHDIGTCNSATGMCDNPAKANGSSCNDNDACTETDTCQSGTCIGQAVTCTALDECHDIGTCDSATGICDNPAKVNGSSCNDNDACTETDTCQSGTCMGQAVKCVAIDSCHIEGKCDASTGICTNPAKPNTATCDDGDACTRLDTCQDGACHGANPVTCTALDECHDVGTCDSTTGICVNPAKPDGSNCESGTCQAGVCNSRCTTDADCDPSFECSSSQCVPKTTDPNTDESCSCSFVGERNIPTPTPALVLIVLLVLALRAPEPAKIRKH